jgi:6-pyruvoyltetrahydropterin/6-carboxytetrahydropterin synthase
MSGEYEALHEHDWQVRTTVSRDGLDNMGLVVDFIKLKSVVKSVTEELEGEKIQESEYFKRVNPSAENVARYIYTAISEKLSDDLMLMKVSVMEEAGCWASFTTLDDMA